MRVRVVAHDPAWSVKAEQEAHRLQTALGEFVVAIHHIGSTAIPSIYAKPIIDFLLEVDSIEILDEHAKYIEDLGYQSMGEYGIPGRRYFRKSNDQGIRTHHVHSFEEDHEEVFKHLVFRDYIIAHPEEAEAYGQLKHRLAIAHPDDIEAYVDGKDPFIKESIARALAWHNTQES